MRLEAGQKSDVYPLEWPDDQLVALINGKRYIIDTGSPASFGREGFVSIFNQDTYFPEEYLGLRADELTRMVGSPVDGLLGLDLLGRFRFSISRESNQICIGTDVSPPVSQRISAWAVMGVSQLQVTTKSGNRLNVFFGTGSKVSYVNPEHVEGLSPIDRVKDFYPTFGVFESDVWELDFNVVGRKVKLRVGVLPELLRQMRKHVGPNSGTLGTELLKTFDVVVDAPQGWYAFLDRH